MPGTRNTALNKTHEVPAPGELTHSQFWCSSFPVPFDNVLLLTLHGVSHDMQGRRIQLRAGIPLKVET